jgi:hypothetical protein
MIQLKYESKTYRLFLKCMRLATLSRILLQIDSPINFEGVLHKELPIRRRDSEIQAPYIPFLSPRFMTEPYAITESNSSSADAFHVIDQHV